MTTMNALPNAANATLATLAELIGRDPNPTPRHGEMLSALKTLARVLGRELHMIPASADKLRPLINRAMPIAAGVSGVRWRNTKSLVRKALAFLDPEIIPARSDVEPLPAWMFLIDKPEAEPLRRGLARFSRYCSLRGIGPEAVTQAVYDGFYQDLEAHCIVRSPRETQQTAGRTWNKAVEIVPGWPPVTLSIADFRLNRSLPLEAFPESFRADIAAYLTPRASDPFDLTSDAPVLRPATIARRQLEIRQFASALVETGWDPCAIRSLADLVQVKAAKAGLRTFWERSGESKTTRIQGMAYMLLTVARHWVKADTATIAALKALSRNLAPPAGGMTEKNKKRLQQFEDPRVLVSLLDLPAKVFAEACRVNKPGKVEARVAQLAVAIEILLMAPIRARNLSQLEVGRTLILDRSSIGHIVIDGSEVKNHSDIEIPLPSTTLDMIHAYLKRFHPILAPPGCMMLFPSADGGHKRTAALSTQISRFVRARCGIAINPHLFRHLAAKLYLEAFPGAYGVVRMLLGHKSIETTIKAYCGTEFAAAFKEYDKLLTSRRNGEPRRRESIRIRNREDR